MDKNTPTSNSDFKLIPFPKDRVVRIDAALGEVSVQKVIESDIEKLKRFRYILIREFLSQIVPMVFNSMAAAGFRVDNIRTSKNAALVVESIKAFMMKEYGIQHTFHDLSEIMFDFDESGALVLNVTLQNVTIQQGEQKDGSETVNVGDPVQGEPTEGPPGPPDGPSAA